MEVRLVVAYALIVLILAGLAIAALIVADKRRERRRIRRGHRARTRAPSLAELVANALRRS